MRIEPVFAKSLFTATCDNVISLIQSVLQQGTVSNVSSILLVGGFAECKMIQNSLKTAFPSINIVLQDDSGVIVLKGAVLFGYKSDIISSRIARCTYGTSFHGRFDKRIHDQKRKFISKGKKYCKNVFDPFIRINTSIPLGHKIEKTYSTDSQTGCWCQYISLIVRMLCIQTQKNAHYSVNSSLSYKTQNAKKSL
ncbi:unnamed protein product [Mytilus edulis]|uniref:Uncharacterized protein n=1 Tax=Mytilus edulis TaxID=6550 RepID=A0A8S3V5R9_MYTED|nr:unnamed protein product [Mytilus edulis]